MKNLIISIAIVFSSVIAIAQSKAEISFEKEVHDFGNLIQGADASTEFIFTNTGTEPLIISNARGSCGCTVPSWPKNPIKPGEKASIKVKYDSNRVGPINKTVTITSNAATNSNKVIQIRGTIDPKPQPSGAPEKPASLMAPSNN